MSIARIALGSVSSKTSLASYRFAAVRTIASTSIVQKDVVQELYLKELKGYKPAPVKADESQVKDLKLPAAPAAPTVDADLAEQLAAYDKAPVESQ
ncbi:ATP synthase complex subunit H-domain-containing protein [Dichotomocladium elegans]|nr:ATP synthase complex subunit H-domain-containing protein [Dichotomocladium elegans]